MTVRNARRIEIQKREEEELRKALKDAGHTMRKIPKKEIVRAVRESKDER